jgi:hypothetical protein
MRWDGSILVGEPARITITEAYAIPSSREEFSSNDLPRDYRVPESIPDDATGLTVFGEHRLRRGLNSKIQGRGGSYRPDIAGTFFFRMSGESCEYSGYSWTDQPFVQNSPRDFERMVLSDASLRGTVDSDADYEELKLDDPKLNPNRSSILFDGDNWYFLEATYEVRQELRQKILSKMMPGHRNFDLDFINLKLHESEERMPFFVEAGVLPPETDVRFPYPPWPSEWEAFLGFPPCNMLWRPARLVGPNQAEWSDIPATKDDLLVTDDVKSIDWLTDFLFRLRFNIYRHTLSVRFTNSPVIYCFNYLDRPGGILQTEIRIVLPESNDIPGG